MRKMAVWLAGLVLIGTVWATADSMFGHTEIVGYIFGCITGTFLAHKELPL